MADSHGKESASKKRKSVDNNNNGTPKKQDNKKKETFDGEDVQISSSELEETNYTFKDGLRYVTPYYYDFNVYTKQRWIGKTLLDVFTTEFIGNTRENYERKIARGDIKVNGKIVPPTTILRDSDYLTHKVHRHEPPVVQTEIRFVENSDIVVVDKPSSIPVSLSPSNTDLHHVHFGEGTWYGQTVLYVTKYCSSDLEGVHRLDRLTSGVLIFTRTRELATKISEEMKNGLVKKEYLARISGNFPEGEIEVNQPIEVKAPRVGVNECKPTGKPCLTKFQKLFYDATTDTSVVKCFPHTGRTHQIRVHLQYLKHPIHNDPLYGHSKVSAQRMEQPTEGTSNFDSECLDCTNPHLDPEENQLVMWLHALTCRGTDWGFETKMPDWAVESSSTNSNNNNNIEKEPLNNNALQTEDQVKT